MAGGRDRRKRVHAVVHALQRPLHAADHGLAVPDVEGIQPRVRRGSLGGIAGAPVAGTELFDLAPAAALEHTRQALFQAIDQQPPLARHRAHQMMELGLDRGKIGEDVGVIELQIVQDRGARPVVDELAALVEEGRVVLVGLDHEEVRRRDARGHAEVLRHAADQEAGLVAGVLQDPRQHRGRRGLAMRAGHRQHPLAAQHMFAEPLRAGHIGQVAVQDRFHQRIAARDHVADHEQIRLQRQLGRIEALDQFDPLGLELRAHRRIDIGVAAGDAVTGLLGQHGKAAHEGAADTEDMNMHGDR